MSENSFKLTYKIFLEADDISQSRIQSSTAFVKNLLENCTNPYFHGVQIDDESDMDDFTLRFYIEHTVDEAQCQSPEHAQAFVPDMAQLLDAVAAAHSFMDMEGSLSWEFQGEKKAYDFRSESGQDFCDFTEL